MLNSSEINIYYLHLHSKQKRCHFDSNQAVSTKQGLLFTFTELLPGNPPVRLMATPPESRVFGADWVSNVVEEEASLLLDIENDDEPSSFDQILGELQPINV